MQWGGVVRPGHIEHSAGTGEGSAQAGPGQRGGNTAASPGWVHQHAAEVVASRSPRCRLIGSQFDDPAIGHYDEAASGALQSGRLVVSAAVMVTWSILHD